jgi:hypothetical protein
MPPHEICFGGFRVKLREAREVVPARPVFDGPQIPVRRSFRLEGLCATEIRSSTPGLFDLYRQRPYTLARRSGENTVLRNCARTGDRAKTCGSRCENESNCVPVGRFRVARTEPPKNNGARAPAGRASLIPPVRSCAASVEATVGPCSAEGSRRDGDDR